jgi:hypothetical protein
MKLYLDLYPVQLNKGRKWLASEFPPILRKRRRNNLEFSSAQFNKITLESHANVYSLAGS